MDSRGLRKKLDSGRKSASRSVLQMLKALSEDKITNTTVAF